MNLFKRNIESLITLNPTLGSRLFAIEGNERYEVFQDPNDPLNVNLYDHHHGVVFYEGQPQSEILTQLDQFENEFSRYPVLFVYGIANGLFVKLLLQNTNHTHIIVIEPEVELLYIALNLIDFSSELNQKRLYFFENHEIDFVRSVGIFSDSQIKVFCKTYHLEPNIRYYEQYYGDSLVQCNAHMVRAIHHVVTGLGNDTTDALIGLEWHLANVDKMVETPTLLELIQKMKTTKTAVIISTGPSLAKQLPLLKTIKEHVTLLSVDASLPILEKYGIKPDVVFSIERVAETAEFYRRTSKEFQEGIICAISSLSHPILVESAANMILQMSMRPFGYTRYFELPQYGYIGIGMSAANMAYEAAFHAKFENIILIGQDLAYGEGGKSHSDGHIFGALKRRKDDVEVEAYGGEGRVVTSMIWNMFRNFFENDIHIASQEGVVTINATEGGARIHGAKELPLSTAIEHYVDLNVIKEPIHLTQPDPENVESLKQEVEKKIAFMSEYVEQTQAKVSGLFEEVAACVEHLDNIKGRTNLQKVDYDELARFMEKIDEVKSLFDDQQFVDIFIDATQALIVHHELEIARIQVRPIKNDDDRRLKMIDWIYAHHHWLFALAGIMEAELVAVRRRGEQSRYVHKAKLSDSGTIISGCFYNYYEEEGLFRVGLYIDGEEISETIINSHEYGKRNFSIALPEKLFNNQVHNVLIKEKERGIILAGMPDERIFFEENRYKAHILEYLGRNNNVSIQNKIGFIANHDNMRTPLFKDFIEDVMRTFSQYSFVAFFITDTEYQELNMWKDDNNFENLEILSLKDEKSAHLMDECLVYIHNVQSEFFEELRLKLLELKNIFVLEFNPFYEHKSFEDLRNPSVFYFKKPELFGFSEKDVECAKGSHFALIYNAVFSRFAKENFTLSLNQTLHQFQKIELIKYIMTYPEIIAELNKIRFTYFKTL